MLCLATRAAVVKTTHVGLRLTTAVLAAKAIATQLQNVGNMHPLDSLTVRSMSAAGRL